MITPQYIPLIEAQIFAWKLEIGNGQCFIYFSLYMFCFSEKYGTDGGERG